MDEIRAYARQGVALSMLGRHRETTYERWLSQENLPVVAGYGVTDVWALELGPWERLGCRGAYIQLEGMEGITGMYVGEIPPGGAIQPEKHLYDELIYILSGRGASEVWQAPSQGADSSRSLFEWQAGSLFTPPGNTWHTLINGSGSEPVRFLGVTNAPIVMDLFHNLEFVFKDEFRFTDRYDGRADYFEVGERRIHQDDWVWYTNFIPDVRGTSLDLQEEKGAGVQITSYEMGGNVLVGHMAEWPVGRYHKAHYHGGGAILLIVRGRGYTLMWPQEAGIHPYQGGKADKVVRVDWQEGSVFSPPTGWFHQHCNTGPEPARQLALRYGSHNYGVQFHDIQSREGELISVKQGGTLIEYEDEDPEIRHRFEQELARGGVGSSMPALDRTGAAQRTVDTDGR